MKDCLLLGELYQKPTCKIFALNLKAVLLDGCTVILGQIPANLCSDKCNHTHLGAYSKSDGKMQSINVHMLVSCRDPEIWRSACLRLWGRSCTKMLPFSSWREMFLERPHVRFDGKHACFIMWESWTVKHIQHLTRHLCIGAGVYISKTSYIRQGEESLDGFYRAWHQVEYYR